MEQCGCGTVCHDRATITAVSTPGRRHSPLQVEWKESGVLLRKTGRRIREGMDGEFFDRDSNDKDDDDDKDAYRSIGG